MNAAMSRQLPLLTTVLWRTVLWSTALWSTLASTGQAADWPPVEAFASLPVMSQPRLSPDGSRLVMLRTVGHTQHAFVTDIDSGKSNPVLGGHRIQFFEAMDSFLAEHLVTAETP